MRGLAGRRGYGALPARRGKIRRGALAGIVAASSVLVAVAASSSASASPAPVLEAWGYNAYGELGNGSTTSSSTPVAVSMPSGVTVTASASGGYHTLAIGSDGNLYAWGQNGYGQLGNGTTTNSSTPVVVQMPAGVQATAVAAGLIDSIALGSNGKVYAWGDNSLGELGDGSTTESSVPVEVSLPAAKTYTAIAAGQYQSLAVARDGNLYAWGYNNDGQLGDGNRTTPTTPQKVSLPSGVTATTTLAAGGYHSMVVGSNGDLYAWGDNTYGQLGNGSTTRSTTPTAVSMPAGVAATALTAGLYHSVALGSNGHIYSWGYNGYGQLGDGTTANASTPTAVSLPGGATATAVAAGLYHTMAIGSNGNVYAWGQNGYGQLGNGTTTDASTPTAVSFPAGTTPISLASDSSSYHSVALVVPAPATTATTVSPSNSSPVYGQAETFTATVTGSDGGGTVTFDDGSTTLCASVPLTESGSTYEAQCTTSTLDAGAHDVAASYSGDSDSQGSTSTALDLDVAQAPLMVTASSAAVTYGDAPPAVTASYTGFVNGDGPDVLTTQATCVTADTATSPVGTYTSSCSGAAAANYSITYAVGSVVVDPAPLSVSASSGTMTYGGTPPVITPSYVGFVNGDSASSLSLPPACSTEATSASSVGTYVSSCSGASDPNYSISYTQGQVVVGAAPLVITASSASTTYGTAVGAITPNYSGFLNGDGASSLTTQPTCTTTAAQTSSVGAYASSCSGASDPNYDISYVQGTVTVTPAPLVITASSASLTYGGSVPSIAPEVDGLQNGEGASVLGTGLSCSTGVTSSSPVGAYASSCSGASDPNYDISYVQGTVTVTPAPLTVTASSDSMTYGGSVPAITPTVSGLQNGDGVADLGASFSCTTTATSTSPVGGYDSSCSGVSDPNYDVTYVDGSVTVTPAPLTVTASSGSMTYGGNVPDITPIVSGLQNGEGVAVLGDGLMCSTSAASSSPVGTYASTCSGAVDPNYMITDVEGTVTVNPAQLEVTASSASDTYGQAPPAITASYTGFVDGDDATSLTTAPLCTTTATSSSPAGTYPSGCSGAVDPNYDITYVNGAVVVGQAALVIVASPASMTYGGSAPNVTPTYIGFTNGDDATSLTTAPLCTTTATSSSPVGTYPSSCSGAVDPNYSITYVDGSVTVAPALLSIAASSASTTYGAAAPSITPTYVGFVNGDDVSSLTTSATCTTTVTPTTPVGSYASTCTGASDANYTITYVDGTVTVSPAPLTITASSGSMTYGGSVPAVTASASGLQNGEDLSVLGSDLTCDTTATSSSSVGTYPSSCSGAVDDNYAISYSDGSLTVSPAQVIVTASSGSFTYGGSVPAITPSVSGLQNGDTAASLGTGLACGTTAGSSSPVGSYPSMCSGAVDSNYTVTYASGTVQVVAAPLVVSASSGSMTYGGTVPTINPSYSGFVNGDVPSSLSDPPVCSTAATSNSPVGNYDSSCSGASDPNYNISYVPGQVVVGTAALVITASSASMTYGGATPTITPAYSGFVNGDGPGSLSTLPTCSTVAASSASVGTYASTCSGAADPDYTITYVPGSVHIAPAPLTVAASSTSITYGGATPSITPTITGFVNGDGRSALGSGLTCATAAGPSSPVGTYASTCSGASDPNYVVSYVPGTVTVAPATLTVTATSQTKLFGAALPTLTATITGFVDGQTLSTSGVTGAPTCSTTATATSPGGTYPITCQPGTLHAANYSFTFVAGTLTVDYTSTLGCTTFGSVTILAGQAVRIAPGCLVLGTITVKSGGALDSEGAVLLGSVNSSGGMLRMCNTSLALLLSVTGSTSPVDIGDGTSVCGGSILIGGVSVSSNADGVSLQRAGAIGVIAVKGNSGGTTVIDNTVLGSLTVTGNVAPVVDTPNTVIGFEQLQ